jgi:hypothetical protein
MVISNPEILLSFSIIFPQSTATLLCQQAIDHSLRTTLEEGRAALIANSTRIMGNAFNTIKNIDQDQSQYPINYLPLYILGKLK